MKKEIQIGQHIIGGSHPVLIQSMTNTKTEDIEQTVRQIWALEAAGCEIVRVSANSTAAAKAIAEIKKRIRIPLVADIHFDYRLALLAMEHGADKIRINPGNMPQVALDAIVSHAKEFHVPIRVGVNSGSIEKDVLEKYGSGPEAMLHSLKKYVTLFEERDFFNLVLSAKASDVKKNIAVNRLLHEHFDYPIHLGVTEAGSEESAIIKSSIGIGSLLYDGIGSTIRISLTGDPVKEIPVAREILRVLGLRKGLDVVACPTCGRTNIDLEAILKQVKIALKDSRKDLRIAIMGCAVNGPGEAREADLGIAGGINEALLFRKGVIIGKYKQEEIVSRLLAEIDKIEE